MTKETIQKEHRILQLKYAALAVVVGICVGIVDTIFGRGLLAISAFRTAHWRCLLPFLPLAGLLIVWMYHHFSTLSLKGMSLVFETGQKKRDQIPLALVPLSLRFCRYKGRKVKSIERRRYVEFSLLFIQ